MNELNNILAKKPEDRSPDDLKYLEEHADELSPEQLEQLDKEAEIDAGDNQPAEPAPAEPVAEPVVEPVDPAVAEKMKGYVGTTVFASFNSKIKDMGAGVMEAIIASEMLDRHGEKIDMKGMDTKEYMKNPIMAPFHNYDEPSVGRTLKLTKMPDGKLLAKFEWAKDQNPKAKVLYDLYKDGFQFAFSIGFIANDVDGNTYTKSTMLEFSPVLVPANAEALLLAKKKGIDTDILIGDNILMLKLEDILKKEVNDLTVAEVKFLKENISKLADADKAKYASVLEVKDVVAEVKTMLDSFKKEFDPVVVKDINTKADPNKATKDAEVAKEDKFKSYVKGLINKDFSEYKTIMKDAMSTSNTGDVLPPTEFIAEVERLEEQYGAARQGGVQLRRTNRSSITLLQGDDDLEIFDTAEGGHKSSTKLGFSPFVLTFRKFAGILPLTDELLEESAVDLWREATTRFARAYTKKEDELVFTQEQGAGKNPGIIHAAGVNYIDIGSSLDDLDFDHLNQAIYGVPTPSAANGKFYLNRKVLGLVQRIKNPTTGRYVWSEAAQAGALPTIWGKPYILTEVLPEDQDHGTDFIVFGDLRYSTLGERTDLQIKIFDAGNVGDPDGDIDGDDLNLLTQDLQAMRAVKRFNAKVRFPAAFSVIGVRSDAS